MNFSNITPTSSLVLLVMMMMMTASLSVLGKADDNSTTTTPTPPPPTAGDPCPAITNCETCVATKANATLNGHSYGACVFGKTTTTLGGVGVGGNCMSNYSGKVEAAALTSIRCGELFPTPSPPGECASCDFSWGTFIGGIVLGAALFSMISLFHRFYEIRWGRNCMPCFIRRNENGNIL